MQGEPTRLKQHLPALNVRTCEPDYRFQDYNQWLRYILLEIHVTKKKIGRIKVDEILQPRLKIMA